MNFTDIFTIKQDLDNFLNNHPKLRPFLAEIGSKQPCEGQEIAIAVRYPDGDEFKAGIRVTTEDLQLLYKLIALANSQQ